MEVAMFHKRRLGHFCRCCGSNVKGKKLVHKSKVEEIAKDLLNEDFKNDDENRNPEKICMSCYNKFTRLKNKKLDFEKKKKKNPDFYDSDFSTGTSLNIHLGDLPCKPDGKCVVCQLELEDENENIEEPSPSKIEKLSNPRVSPIDLKKKSKGNQNLKGKPRKSLYVEKSEGPEQKHGETDVIKVYVSENALRLTNV